MLEPFFAPPTRQARDGGPGRKKTTRRSPAATATAPSKTFEFVSSGPVGKPDPGVRKFIRSHVMRGKNTKRRGSDAQRKGAATKKHLSVGEDTATRGHLPVSESRGDATTKGHPSVPGSHREHVATESHILIPESRQEHQDVATKSHLSVSEPRREHVASTHTETRADTFIQFECLPGLFRLPCDLRLFNFSSPLDETSTYLIFRFLTTIKETMYPVEWCFATDPTKVCWFRWLLEDAGYLHAVFFMVSAFQDLLTLQDSARGAAPGTPWSHGFSPRTRVYLRRTIRALRDNLDDEQRQLRDTTASAVISLAMVADAAGDTEAFEAHVRGLKQMVRLRGGLKGFSDNRQLQVKLCRVDLGWSIKYGSKPDMYGTNISWDPFLEPALRANSLAYTRSLPPAVSNLVDGWDPKLRNVFHDARDFSCVANRLIPSRAKLPPELFQDIMLSIQYRLLLLDYSSSAETPRLEEAVRLGLLAFESTVFLQIPGVKIRSDVFAKQLHGAVEGVTASSPVLADVKLWLLLVGSISVFEGGEDWLVDAVRELTGDQTWAEVRRRVKKIMWIDTIHDDPGRVAFEATQRGRVL